MSSMISFFGCNGSEFIDNKKSSGKFCWDGNLDIGSNLNELKDPVSQMKVLLEQSLAAAYWVKFYGRKCNDMVTEFIDELASDVTGRFTRTCVETFVDNYLKVYHMLLDVTRYNRGGKWTNVDIGLIDAFLFDGDARENTPRVWPYASRGCLIPFLMWMNTNVDPNYEEFAGSQCGFTTMEVNGTNPLRVNRRLYRIQTSTIVLGQSFSVKPTPIDQCRTEVLQFFSHFNWSTCQFETCVAYLTRLLQHTDIEREGLTMSHHLAYCIKTGILPTFNISGYTVGVEATQSMYKHDLFGEMVRFVDYCATQRGMLIEDMSVIARIFGYMATTKVQKDSVIYLLNADARASAEKREAFNKTMGSYESFNLISQNPIPMEVQTSLGAMEDAADDAEANKQDSNKSEQTSDKADEKKPEPEKKEETKDDNSESSNDDDGADDTQSDDTLEEAPETADDQNATTDGTAGEDPNSQPAPAEQTAPAEPEVNTSDDKGIAIKFDLPDNATVDSVLFREEMYKFLSNVLTNPPKCMSPQSINVLNALRRYWLSCLSIETIKEIVEACIKLPKSLTNSIQKDNRQ